VRNIKRLRNLRKIPTLAFIFILILTLLRFLPYSLINNQKSYTALANEPGKLRINSAAQLLWAKVWGGPKEDIGRGVAVDSNGSLYYIGNMGIEGYPYPSGNLTLSKFFSNGTQAWQVSSSTIENAAGVAVDKDGFIYCVGKSLCNLMLVKFFPNGTEIWEKNWCDVGAFCTGVAVDNQGGIYCSGEAYCFGQTWMIIVKFLSNGTKIWQYDTFNEGGTSIGIAMSRAGYIYGVGATSYALFVIKLSQEGQRIWERWQRYDYRPVVGEFLPIGVAAADNDSIYCLGEAPVDSGYEWGNPELIKFYPNGTMAWDICWVDLNITVDDRWGGYYGCSITGNGKGSIYCVVSIKGHEGIYTNLALIKAFPNGTKAWHTTWNDSQNSSGYGVAMDGKGAIYCTGGTGPSYGEDFLLLKYVEPMGPNSPILHEPTTGNEQVTLTWESPTNSGGSAITNYKLYRGNTTGAEIYLTTIDATHTYTDTGLRNGQPYYYRASAVNEFGEGPLSNEVSAISGITPSAPQNLQAAAGICSITLTWQAPSNNGTLMLTNYKIYRGNISGAEIYLITISTNLYYTDTGLTNRRPYYYKVSAVNGVGEGALSNESSAIPITPPIAPRNLGADALLNNSIILWWQEPSSDGGSNITNYKIYRGNSSGAEIYLTTIGNNHFYNDTSSKDRHRYYYKVSAVNGIGEGALSNEINATPRTIPTAPQNLQAIARNASILLTWQAPSSNGGSVIINYKIYRGSASDAETYLTTIGKILNYTDMGLSNGITYYYKISAVNRLDEGHLSTEVNATPATIPSVPQCLQALTGNRQITLSWQAPSSNGNSAIINYQIYRSESSGKESLLTTLGNVLTYVDQNLTNGHLYYYKISAINGIGEGGLSIEVNNIPATKPNAPDHLLIRVENGKIVISWQVPADNGGASIIGYNIYRGTSSGNETFFLTIGNLSSFLDANLLSGQTYYYRITAVNAMGESPYSVEVVAMVYFSGNENQSFYLIIILLLGVVALVTSGFMIYLNRKIQRLESTITKKSIELLGIKAAHVGKMLATEPLAVKNQLSQSSIPETHKEYLYGKISANKARILLNSLILRLNRLYKLDKRAEALVLLETLIEIAVFLGDTNKLDNLLGKYEELQEKQ